MYGDSLINLTVSYNRAGEVVMCFLIRPHISTGTFIAGSHHTVSTAPPSFTGAGSPASVVRNVLEPRGNDGMYVRARRYYITSCGDLHGTSFDCIRFCCL